MVNFRWAVIPLASLRHTLVLGGTVVAAVLAAWRRFHFTVSPPEAGPRPQG